MDRIVHVPLDTRAYDVRIGPGLLPRAGALIAPLLHRPRVAIVTDATVADLHLQPLQDGLKAAGIDSVALTLPAGEATKSWPYLTQTVEWMLAEKVERMRRTLSATKFRQEIEVEMLADGQAYFDLSIIEQRWSGKGRCFRGSNSCRCCSREKLSPVHQ